MKDTNDLIDLSTNGYSLFYLKVYLRLENYFIVFQTKQG